MRLTAFSVALWLLWVASMSRFFKIDVFVIGQLIEALVTIETRGSFMLG